jgi:hypothetical protein
MVCIVTLGIAAHSGSRMSNLREAMKHTTELFRAQVEAVQISGGNGLPAAPIRRKLETLLRHEIDDRKTADRTLRILRKNHREVKVIALSGHFPELLHNAELLGAIKSWSKPELLELVRTLLGDEH